MSDQKEDVKGVYKCGFPLAEERKKQKTFFSHAAGSLGTGVWGVSGHVAHVGFSFCFAICHCLTCPTHPPGKTCRRCKVEVNLFSSHCHCRTVTFLC